MADTPNYSLAQVVTNANTLAERRKADEQLRAPDMREWAQNVEFYNGNQWVFWNRVSNKVETLPTEDGDKPRYKVRLKQNRIRKGVHRWIAQMTKNKPVIYASPNTSTDRDQKAAQLAEGLYEHLWRELSLTSELQRALLFSALNQGYWEITYDPFAGKPQRHIIDPHTGAPIDGPLAELLLEEVMDLAKQSNVPEEVIRAKVEKITYEGEISVRAVPGPNVLIDPSADSFDKAAYAIITHNLTPDEIKARWKKDTTPDAVPTETQPSLMFQRVQDRRPKTVRRVFCGYFRPSPSMPKGRYVVWIESPNEILYEGDWPFPFRELPLVKFPGHESTSGPLDLPPTTEARPLQKELNRSISQVIEHKDLTLRPQMVAPVGSLRQRITANPGEILQYVPIAGLVPEWRPIPNLPSYVFDHIASIKVDIDDIYNAMPTQRDQLPARIDSGGGIDLIQEAVADQLLPPIRRLEEALVRAGYLIAMLAQHFYTEPRLLKLKGANGGVATKKFRAADLRGGFSFHAESGSGLPRTRAGKQARVEFLLEHQLIDGPSALKFLDMADMTGVVARIEADEDHALREHEKMIKGQPLNEQAIQQALMALQSGQADPSQAEQILMQAAFSTLTYENVAVHERIHREYMTTEEYEALPQDAKQRFQIHYDATFERLMQLRFLTPGDPPRVTLGLKGTTSAAVAGQLLRRSGIQVTDEQVAEPPLDTWVNDSVDKPNAEDTANSHMDTAGQLLQMQHAEEMHQLNTAKAAHETALAEHRVIQTRQAMRQSAEQHQTRQKQVVQSGS